MASQAEPNKIELCPKATSKGKALWRNSVNNESH